MLLFSFGLTTANVFAESCCLLFIESVTMCYYLRKARMAAGRGQLKLKGFVSRLGHSAQSPPNNRSSVNSSSPSSPARIISASPTTTSPMVSPPFGDLSRTAKADLPEESVRTIHLPTGSLAPLEESHYFKWRAGGFVVKSVRKLQSTIKRAQEERKKAGKGPLGGKSIVVQQPSNVRSGKASPVGAAKTSGYNYYPQSTWSMKASRAAAAANNVETSPSASSSDEGEDNGGHNGHGGPIQQQSPRPAAVEMGEVDSKTEKPLPSLRENPIPPPPPFPPPPPLPPQTTQKTWAKSKLHSNSGSGGEGVKHADSIFAQTAASQAEATRNKFFADDRSAATSFSRGLQQPLVTSYTNSGLVGEDSLRLGPMQAAIEPTEKNGPH